MALKSNEFTKQFQAPEFNTPLEFLTQAIRDLERHGLTSARKVAETLP